MDFWLKAPKLKFITDTISLCLVTASAHPEANSMGNSNKLRLLLTSKDNGKD